MLHPCHWDSTYHLLQKYRPLNLPSVSVIIPCRNEEQYIRKCIDSVVKSNYPKDKLSVYVCDGMSNDSTRSIIQELIKDYSNIFLLDNHAQVTPLALNLGLKKSNADVKIILGAHSEVDSNFVRENVNALSISEDIGCVGGVLTNVYENETAEIIGLAMSSGFGVGNAHFRTGSKSGYVDTVAFGAYKKEVFNQVGYFDEDLVRNQDDEFNFRLIKNGFKIYLSDKIKCKYYVRASYKKLFKQYDQYGYWKVFVNCKHKTITTLRQMVPLFFVLYLISLLLTGLFSTALMLGYGGILICYLLGAIYFASKQTKNLSKMVKVAYSFAILHISYGYGYLRGVVAFILLGKKPSQKSKTLSR